MPDIGKIAVLGDVDFVMPFAALAVDRYIIDQTDKQLLETTKKIIEEKYALVIAAENIAPAVEQAFLAYQNMPVPCLVVVPFTTESTGFATQALAKVLKIATGIDIYQKT